MLPLLASLEQSPILGRWVEERLEVGSQQGHGQCRGAPLEGRPHPSCQRQGAQVTVNTETAAGRRRCPGTGLRWNSAWAEPPTPCERLGCTGTGACVPSASAQDWRGTGSQAALCLPPAQSLTLCYSPWQPCPARDWVEPVFTPASGAGGARWGLPQPRQEGSAQVCAKHTPRVWGQVLGEGGQAAPWQALLHLSLGARPTGPEV